MTMCSRFSARPMLSGQGPGQILEKEGAAAYGLARAARPHRLGRTIYSWHVAEGRAEIFLYPSHECTGRCSRKIPRELIVALLE